MTGIGLYAGRASELARSLGEGDDLTNSEVVLAAAEMPEELTAIDLDVLTEELTGRRGEIPMAFSESIEATAGLEVLSPELVTAIVGIPEVDREEVADAWATALADELGDTAEGFTERVADAARSIYAVCDAAQAAGVEVVVRREDEGAALGLGSDGDEADAEPM